MAVTWNPSDKAAGATLSGGNLTATGGASYGGRATASITSAKIYFEVTFSNIGGIPRVGWCDNNVGLTNGTYELGDWNKAISYNPANGQIRYNGGAVGTIATALTTDVVCVEWDSATHTFKIRINNGSWNSFTNMDPAGSAIFPAYEVNGSTPSITARFLASSWSFAPESGYESIDPVDTIFAQAMM